VDTSPHPENQGRPPQEAVDIGDQIEHKTSVSVPGARIGCRIQDCRRSGQLRAHVKI
jgi:hypothetical protein